MNYKQANDRKAELYSTIRNLQHKVKAEGRPMTEQEYKDFTQAENAIQEIDFELRQMKQEESQYNWTGTKQDSRAIVGTAFLEEMKGCVNGKQRGFGNNEVRATISAVTTSTSFGGEAVPENVLDQVFFENVANDSFLGQLSVIDTSGAGTTKVPKLERGNGPSVEGRADETTQLVGSTLQFTANTFDPENMYVLTRFANNLIRDGIPATGGAILRACQQELKQHLTTCVLSGDATTNGEFDGLDNYTGVQTVDAGGLLTDWEFVIDAYEALLTKNVMKGNVKAVMHPTVWKQIAGFAGTDGHYIDRPNELEGLDIIVTSAAPTTSLYIGDWSQIYLGMSGDFQMTLTERYADYDQSAFLLLSRADMKIFDEEAMCIIQGISAV